MAKILVAEDDKDLRDSVRGILQRHSHEAVEATDVESARIELNKDSIEVVLVDMRMPPSNQTKSVDMKAGLAVIDYAVQQAPSPTCIVMTAYQSVENMSEAIQRGAWDYIEKPFSTNRLLSRVESALEQRKVKKPSPGSGYRPLIGGSEAVRDLQKLINRAAQIDATVLITGETGTGKELVARAIHYESARRDYSFVDVNCANIHPDRMESDLFGHKKGAYTGATLSRLGYFRAANKGTIFLDEIGDMPLDVQAGILRTLEEQTVSPFNEDKAYPINVRVIAATKQNIKQAMEAGKFREDLYFRLNIFPITVPPLRKRQEDIPLLTDYFFKKYRSNSRLEGISNEAMDLLYQYDWPGNVRELENAVLRSIALAEDTVIQPSDLLPSLRGPISSDEFGSSRWPVAPEKALYESFKHLAMSGNSWNMIEYWLVAAALSNTNKVQSKAADLIFMSTTTLSDKIKQIKKNWEAELKDALEKRGRQQREIDEEIEDRRQKIGELKTRDEWKQFAENYLLCVKATR